MNESEMQSAWNSPTNNLSREEHATLARRFTRQMVRRRRFQAAWLINTFFWLAVITILAARAIAMGKVQFEHEWALIPFLVVPWLFAFHFLRRFLKPASGTASGERPVIDSLRAARASIANELSGLKRVGVLFAAMIPLLVLCMYQLREAGKVSPNELASMAVFFSCVLALSGAGIATRYFGRLLPQQRKIDALLADLSGQTQ
jgi:hypothetical protein